MLETLTIGDIAGGLGAFLVIITVIAFFVRMFDKVKSHDKSIENIKEVIYKRDFESRIILLEKRDSEVTEIKRTINIMARAISALLDHELNGDIDGLKSSKKELDSEKGVL